MTSRMATSPVFHRATATAVVAAAAKPLRHVSNTAAATTAAHRNQPPQNHEFLAPNSYVGSWETPRDPREAEAKLAMLRREYKKQVKETRKKYIQEMEVMRLEKLRKDEAQREAARVAREERNKVKAAQAKVRAEERMVAEEEFRSMLLKERAEKLENWRMKEQVRENKKKEARELLCRKSSLWIDESQLAKKILDTVVDATTL